MIDREQKRKDRYDKHTLSGGRNKRFKLKGGDTE